MNAKSSVTDAILTKRVPDKSKLPNEHNYPVMVDRKSIHPQIVYNLLALKERKAVNVNAH